MRMIWTAPRFDKWLAQAQPGDECVYAKAYSLDSEEPVICEARDHVYKAYQRGAVALFQRKGLAGYQYVAICLSHRARSFLRRAR